MASRKLFFHIVDVFAETAYAGNQLAVFHGDLPDSAEMQQIAREINFAETVFLPDPQAEGGRHHARIFTPEAELPFAGHPTLGSVHVLRTCFGRGISMESANQRLALSLAAGDIPVVWTESPDHPEKVLYQMTQRPPTFGNTVPASDAADWLGLRDEDISRNGPCCMVTTGLPFLIVPLVSLDAVRRASLSREGARGAATACDAAGVMVFSHEGREAGHDLSARVFVHELGVPEDPATGSAHGCLTAWLLRQMQGETATLRLISGQGHEIGRPSVLHLAGSRNGDTYTLEVGGRCRIVAEGKWY